MNIAKSTRIALAQQEKDRKWLAEQLGFTHQRLSVVMSKKAPTGEMIQRLAKAFNMNESDFVALGE